MKKESFDKILKETLREYVKNTESEPDEKIRFSKRHERKMEEIFSAIENGTLGNFEVEEERIEKLKENRERNFSEFSSKFTFNRMAKVAIIVLLALVVSLAVTPVMEAWKTDDLNLYEDEYGEYAWVLPNDISEVLDPKVESGKEYLEIFGWLPENITTVNGDLNEGMLYISIYFGNKSIKLRVGREHVNMGTDVQSAYSQASIGDNFVSYVLKDDRYSFFWICDEKKFHMYGDLEYMKLLEVIKNINYEKINRFFS